MMKVKFPPILKSKYAIKMISGLIAASSIVIGFVYGYLLFFPWETDTRDITITIERGNSPQTIAKMLNQSHIIPNKKNFLISAKFLGVSRTLQAGKYSFRGRQSNYKVLRKLYMGKVVTERVTIPEGMRATRIAKNLKNKIQIDSNEFLQIVNDPSVCKKYQIKASSLEGYLYPDTYQFHVNPTANDVIDRMVTKFWEVFNDSLKIRVRETGLTLHEVITLASIVEGEAVVDSERTIIAALYWNRLKRRMRLQADPTIQYIIRNGPRRLYTKDLSIDSPYNTYLHYGLPPGPVNNPGRASIYAVLYPSTESYIYMVANGDGSHTFSKSISNHLKAKGRLDRIRDDYRRRSR
jgi:UPF0755 protein